MQNSVKKKATKLEITRVLLLKLGVWLWQKWNFEKTRDSWSPEPGILSARDAHAEENLPEFPAAPQTSDITTLTKEPPAWHRGVTPHTGGGIPLIAKWIRHRCVWRGVIKVWGYDWLPGGVGEASEGHCCVLTCFFFFCSFWARRRLLWIMWAVLAQDAVSG